MEERKAGFAAATSLRLRWEGVGQGRACLP
jgi:hypothetical protein